MSKSRRTVFFQFICTLIFCEPVWGQSWTESEQAARDFLTLQEEQITLSEEYLEIARLKFAAADAEDTQEARVFRSIEERALTLNSTLAGLIEAQDLTSESAMQRRLEQRIATTRLDLAAAIKDLEAGVESSRKTVDARSAAKHRLEEAELLVKLTQQKLSTLKLQMADAFEHLAPPILEEVDVLKDGAVIYHGFWKEKENELRERIALADAIIEDYEDKIDGHRRRVETWIEVGIQKSNEHAAAEKAYQEFFQSFDETSWRPTFLQIENYGSGVWQTMGADASSRVISIFTNKDNFGGPGGATIYEAVWATYDGYAWYNGAVRNTTWDVVFDGRETRAGWRSAITTGADKAIGSITASPTAMKIYNNKPLSIGIGSSLQAMYQHFNADETLKIEDLRRMFRKGEVAGAFTENIVHGGSPSASFSSAKAAVGSKAFRDYWKSPRGISKAIGRKLFSPGAFTGYGRSLLLSGLDAAVLSRVEEQRLALWGETHSTYGHFWWLQNRAIAEKMFMNQAIEHQAGLIAERENLRRLLMKQKGDRFVLDTDGNGVLVGRDTFELWLTFSRPVVVTSIKLHNKTVEIDQGVSGGHASKVWKAEFDLEGLAEVNRLAVDAIDDVSRKNLADPRHPPLWDPDRGTFSRHKTGPDRHHLLRALPMEDGKATAIVFDSSGSMEDDGKIIAAKRAVTSLLRKMNPGRADVFGVFTFESCRVRESQSIDGSINKAREAIAAVEPEGDTPLGAAIRLATDALLDETNRSDLSLIIVTDGEDTCGGLWQKELARANTLLNEARAEVIQ